jgi:DNA-binding LacI/PurR family transcriptional regulator
MTATLQDIARRAGVSIATVSRALRGSYPVAIETQEKIREAMHALDYVPNDLARRFLEGEQTGSGHTGNIGLVMGGHFQKFSDPFWSAVLDGVYSELHEQHYQLRFTFATGYLSQKPYQHQINHASIDGLLFVGIGRLPEVPEAQRPTTVAIESDWEMPLLIDNVMVDKRLAMHAVVDHLYTLGRRRIHFITGSLGDERTLGFVEAIRKYDLSLTQDTCLKASWALDQAYPPILDFLQTHGQEIDALVCASDHIAVAAMRAAVICGLRVPQDIAVTGYNDVPLARDLDPPLTTVAVPKELMGKLAVRKLIERIREPELPPIVQIVPTTLVVRASCGANI